MPRMTRYYYISTTFCGFRSLISNITLIIMDVVKQIKDGNASFEWAEIHSKHNGHQLYISVFRDALKIGGIRYPATAKQLQQIADVLGCMLLTPKVVDLIWLQASLQFNAITQVNGKIVAACNAKDVSEAIDKKIERLGGDPGGIIASVGKYWVLVNRLSYWPSLKYKKQACCNYGWMSSSAPYRAVTPIIKLWQTPGFRHNDSHVDPSQVIRLMYRFAHLIRNDGSESTVDLQNIATDPELCHLISHEGPLKYLRQISVPEPQATVVNGAVILPEMVIYPRPNRY